MEVDKLPEMSKNVFMTNLFPHRDKKAMLPKKCVWSGFLILVGLGLMLALLSGCGSGSNPASKTEKTAKRAVGPAATQLLSQKKGVVQKSRPQRIEVVPGYTQAELDARHAKLRKEYLKYRGNMEVAPGLLQREVEARQAELQKKYKEYRTDMEIAPGMTQEQLAARHARLLEKFNAPDTEVVPGLTREELKDKMRHQVRPQGYALPSAGK